ncbi:hypothetical protein SAMN05421678_11981 [Actinopolymorpha cephalotaxi]|uniref:Uncharacterized protein n=1 Tax=Actinopolymorpha cephalotaxi TaxID=504797 RepID=A0A1I3AIH8_9ACTN|nr:hypothetical protein [Actinopolymorpha cephalotaxi]NYH82171.1 hypothetical protein [Actinopolymorpha cephalotaxi]SFH49770.1 hypothetical protein SAMN05421678_11981 [Actinopolymorpha cephalotaxi]
MLMHNLMLNDLAHARIADLHREVAAIQLARLARKPRPCAPYRPAVHIPRQRGQARPLAAPEPGPARRRAVRLLSLLGVRRYAPR